MTDEGISEPTLRYDPRFSVQVFAKAMEEILQDNDYKVGWGEGHCDMAYLEQKLLEEYTEYQRSRNDPIGMAHLELVDLANICMMLYHRRLNNTNCMI